MNSNRILCIWVLIFIITSSIDYSVLAQVVIEGEVQLDTAWYPAVYMKEVHSLYDMYSSTEGDIIDSSRVDKNGRFSLSFNPRNSSGLVRIHVRKRDDPVATLIIGSAEENHMFLGYKDEERIEVMLKNDMPWDDFMASNEINVHLKNIDLIVRDYKRQDNLATLEDEKLSIREASAASLIEYADTTHSIMGSIYAAHMADEGFNRDEVIVAMERIYARLGNHSYLEVYPIERKPLILNRVLYFLVIISVIGFGGYLVRLFRKIKNTRRLLSLSPREVDVFKLIKSGKSNKEIARELNVEISTVKSHVNSIYSKLAIKSRNATRQFKVDNL